MVALETSFIRDAFKMHLIRKIPHNRAHYRLEITRNAATCDVPPVEDSYSMQLFSPNKRLLYSARISLNIAIALYERFRIKPADLFYEESVSFLNETKGGTLPSPRKPLPE
jgi:hypothetical protein